MTHLSPDEVIDAIESALAPERRTHLIACDRCGAEVAELAATLREARAVEIPAPSPLFWDHLSRRVREAVDGEAAARTRPSGTSRWFDWRVLAPVATWALVVALLSSAMSGIRPTLPGVILADRGMDDLDGRWAVMLDMIDASDVATAWDEGLIGHRWGADGAILDLTAAEQQELLRLLNEELR